MHISLQYLNRLGLFLQLTMLMLVFVQFPSWFSKVNFWVMFHFYKVCFGIIWCDCNTTFYIHLLICLYKLVVVLLVLMLSTYQERFSFCISLASDSFLFFYNCMEKAAYYLNILFFGKCLSNSLKKNLVAFVTILLL